MVPYAFITLMLWGVGAGVLKLRGKIENNSSVPTDNWADFFKHGSNQSIDHDG
jgi:hypothetical protein